MFSSEKARECLDKLIGWKEHYDNSEIPAFVNPSLKETETGEYYQEKHPAMRLDLIESTLPSNLPLEDYLASVQDSAITELLNDVTVAKELSKTSKELVANDVIYNSEGWVSNTITNESRFVGIRFRPLLSIGLKAVINRFALQLTSAQAGLTVYIYHSHRAKFLKKITYTTTQGGQFNWMEILFDMMSDDKDLSGGSFYIGYYQDDLTGQAVKYDKLNWRTGFCGGCDGGVNQTRYTSISKYVNMTSFYVPAASLNPNHDDMFSPEDIIETDDTNWGFNFNISVKCDLTNFWCDNRMTLRTALGLKVVHKVLKDISFSQQINHIEEQLKMMIIRDLEGDKETNYINIPQQYERALKAIKFDHSSINSICLPCSVNSGVSYSTM